MNPFDGRRLPFASCGEDVLIYELTRILGAEAMHIGDHVIIDDFVFIDGRAGMRIGSYVHIAGFSSIIGQGACEIGDFAGFAAGVRIITGSDRLDGSGLVSPTIPDDLRSVHRGRVVIGEFATLATNTIVHPDVTIGEGAVTASGSIVTRDLPPWTICRGAPARPIRERPRDTILANAAELRRRHGT